MFVFGKLTEIGQSETCEVFGIAFAAIPSPIEVTLKQATTPI
jgi:hypothetical protein